MDKQFINLTKNCYFYCKKFQLKESVKRQKYIIHKSEKNFFKYNSFISIYVEQILGYVIKTALKKFNSLRIIICTLKM